MKLKKIFFTSGFCIIIFILFSCVENKQKPDFTVSSNIINSKIQTDDTLTIRVNSINKNFSGISFEIKSNNKVRKIKPINLNSVINSEYQFLLNNITLGKKELFIKAENTSKKISFTLLSHVIPTVLDYEILNVFDRPNNSYTQGLEFYNDTLYESLGQYGKSKLVKVDFRNGNILKEYKLKSNFFAEGITVLNNKIYQLTWKEKIGFVYDVNTFDQINSFEYNKSLEGWGICNDGSKLYKSDGTEKIWLLDPNNQKEDGFIEIYTNKNKVVGLNELEWVNGKIFANRYLFDGIAIINPINGGIEAVINLSSLKNMVTKHEKLDVINGIAYNDKRNSIFVTGKMWDKIFEIRIKK